MNLFFSFILTVIIYILIVVAFLFFLFPKIKKKEKKIYVHTAIIAKKSRIIKKGSNRIRQNSKKRIGKAFKKGSEKKGSKTNITKGGEEIGFNDIFKNVDYNVSSKKVVLKGQSDMSRLKGVESNLKSLKAFNINLVQNNGEKLTNKEYSEIEYKLYAIWDSVSELVTDYVEAKIENINGKIYVTILNSNLDLDKQNELIKRIGKEKFDKEFDLTVLFQSKERND